MTVQDAVGNCSDPGRPNSLTSIAPATLNRSVIPAPISASSSVDSRVRGYRALLLLATFANLRFGELAGLRRAVSSTWTPARSA
jgi:hypothetical protein